MNTENTHTMENLKLFSAKNFNGLHHEVVVTRLKHDLEFGKIEIDICHKNGGSFNICSGIVRFEDKSIERRLVELDLIEITKH